MEPNPALEITKDLERIVSELVFSVIVAAYTAKLKEGQLQDLRSEAGRVLTAETRLLMWARTSK